MFSKKQEKTISWDDFRALGNPENAEDIVEEESNNNQRKSQSIKLHYEKKGRGGKEAIIIRGIIEPEDEMKNICKEIKTKLGVGGSTKDGEIIIQGNKRDRMIEILRSLGFADIKKAGG